MDGPGGKFGPLTGRLVRPPLSTQRRAPGWDSAGPDSGSLDGRAGETGGRPARGAPRQAVSHDLAFSRWPERNTAEWPQRETRETAEHPLPGLGLT